MVADLNFFFRIEPQEFPHQAEACQSPEAEPSYPPVDSSEDR